MSWKLKERFRSRIAEEKGSIRKDWGAKIRIALAFPNRYALGMSNLGYQDVYGRLNALPDVVCERVFYPEPEDLSLVRSRSGMLLSLESQRPVMDFDLLAFSIPFENDYPHILEMLVLAGVGSLAAERGEDQLLVAAGGVAVFINPEPLAPFIDLFFIGEGEILLPSFLDALRDSRGMHRDKKGFLRDLARNGRGFYVPSLYRPHYRRDGLLEAMEPQSGAPARIAYQTADLVAEPVCRSRIITADTEFSDMNLVEIGRGCGRGCRFCAAGFVYRPPRFVEVSSVVDGVRAGLEHTRRVGLVSAAVSDHPDIEELCERLLELDVAISFSSVRADNLNEAVLKTLSAGARHAIAIAPEAGSERLRKVLNKHLGTRQILDAVELLAEFDVLSLKLYMMIGLPTEQQEDLEALVELVKQVKHHVLKKSRGKKRLGTITVSVNCFVPKPFTPFQWVPFAGVRDLKASCKWIKKALAKVANVRVHFDLPKWAYIQALLSRGDRRVGRFLEAVAVQDMNWSQAMRSVAHNPDFWVTREREQAEVFPWEIIDHGMRRSFLWQEYQRALEAKESPFCVPDQACNRCGICASSEPEAAPG